MRNMKDGYTLISTALFDCIVENKLLPERAVFEPELKVALVGELEGRFDSYEPEDQTLKFKLEANYSVDITTFSDRNMFTVNDGKRFDVLIGSRPCEGDRTVLESATKYNKRFILMPCTCGGKQKSVSLIREFPIITHIDAIPSVLYYPTNSLYDAYGWIILFNKG